MKKRATELRDFQPDICQVPGDLFCICILISASDQAVDILLPNVAAEQFIGLLIELREMDIDSRFNRSLAEDAAAKRVNRADEAAVNMRE